MATIMILDLYRGLDEVKAREQQIRILRLRGAKIVHAARKVREEMGRLEDQWLHIETELTKLTGTSGVRSWIDVVNEDIP